MDLSSKKVTWKSHPFPHAIIDNFFPEDIFKQISSFSAENITDLKRTFTSDLELNKKVFGIEGTSDVFRKPISLMGKDEGKKLFKDLMNSEKIITLADHNNFAGYYPFHSSANGGLLGSHIDHSNLGRNFHFANSIFFSHPKWKKEWGGETILFNSSGFKPVSYVEPKPNRMVLFIHSNESFHGVKLISCPKDITRNSYYMDYYIQPEDIENLNKNLRKINLKRSLIFTYHRTTFLPLFPEGIHSFKISNLFRKTTLSYLINYVIYRILKLRFLSYLRYLYLEKKPKKGIQT